jgi:nitrite reductase/ring-hydroxylating ferredoxin subunit
MNKGTWVHWLLASIVILLVGVALVAAEERIEVKVETDGGDEITVDVNGQVETIHLEDLADGEERSFDVGDHSLVVKRVGDELKLTSDGHAFGALGGHGKSLDTMVWVSDDGEEIEIDGACDKKAVKKIVVMKSGAEGDGEAKTYKIRIDGDDVMLDKEMNIEIDEIMTIGADGHPHAVFISEEGHGDHPVIVKTHHAGADLVKFRCEETGSVLLVKKDNAYHDTYICPATGCVMTKVEEAEMKVIEIRKTIEIEEEEEE